MCLFPLAGVSSWCGLRETPAWLFGSCEQPVLALLKFCFIPSAYIFHRRDLRPAGHTPKTKWLYISGREEALPPRTEVYSPEAEMLARFTPELRDQFLDWLFSEDQVARRPKEPRLRRRAGLLSKHISLQRCDYLHGSDMVERIYVAVRVLERLGSHNRLACYKVAGLLPESFGESRRGKPTCKAKSEQTKPSRKAETVRSLVNAFAKKQHPWRDLLPARDLLVVEYVGRFLWLHNRMTAWSQKSLLHGKWQSKAAAMSPLQAVIWTYCMRSVLYCIVQSTFIHETNVDKWKGRG